ncbi:unnamed protein product [Cyprideis torosa]|uniref:Conserved oligomeric Golgi complex subunit 7 n=1 Tax=Cyprideis torosa TaxID=163714 RepID=A0A7R8WG27_9CRUS|nr:unnamed protein product [Cyprideis torosa]CAG0892162.1 unnamed protein product [Cyprideis torosa]
MDLTPFHYVDFDVSEWVNSVFDDPNATKDRDGHAASIVMKLQLSIQEVSRNIEDTSNQVICSLPRIIRDVEMLRQESLLLRDKMHELEMFEAEANGHAPPTSVAVLEKLDKAKTNLMETAQAIKQADQWTTLLSDVEDVFDTGKLSDISDKLQALSQSLSLLSHVPDFDSRASHLEGLKNRFEALLSPHLIACFGREGSQQEQHADARRYREMLSAIGRAQQFIKYFHSYRRGLLLKEWARILDEGDTLEWIAKLHDSLTAEWKDQGTFLKNVGIEQPGNVLCDLISDVYRSLDPPVQECMNAALKQQRSPSTALSLLSDLEKFCFRFLASLLQTSKLEDIAKDKLELLATLVYASLKSCLSKYQALEKQALLKEIQGSRDSGPADEDPDLLERSGQFREKWRKVGDALKASFQRMVSMSHGACLLLWLESVSDAFKDMVEEFEGFLQDLQTLTFREEPWALVQLASQLLMSMGSILLELESIDRELTQATLKGGFFPINPAVFGNYPEYLLSRAKQDALRRTLLSLREAEMPSLLSDAVLAPVTSLALAVRRSMLEALTVPGTQPLKGVTALEIWKQSEDAKTRGVPVAELPDFSFSPQEYVTRVGQYILTLPQHLESISTVDDPKPLLKILSLSEDGKSPKQIPASEVTAHLLSGICTAIAVHYMEAIIKLEHLGEFQSRQLAADLEYLNAITDDLGLQPHDQLHTICSLLKLSRENFFKESTGFPHKLVSVVRHMREIKPQ